MAKISAQELKWRAESDADIMSRYQQIMEDPDRRKRAVSAAKEKAKELTQSANAMQRAAGGKISSRKK